MPFPIRIDHNYQRPPWATLALVATNVVMFVWALSAPVQDVESLVLSNESFQLHQLITSNFLHLGLFHLLGNMLFLWVFGRYVEARLDWWRFLLLYLACAIGGDLLLLLEMGLRDRAFAAVGSSGAIAGLMGFTLVAAPRAEVRLFWTRLDRGDWPAISAWFILGGWILWQILLYMLAGSYLGTAFMAHFGGLLTGAGIGWLMHHEVTRGTLWHMERAAAGGSLADAKRTRTARMWKETAEELRSAREAQEAAQRQVDPQVASDEPIDWPLDASESKPAED